MRRSADIGVKVGLNDRLLSETMPAAREAVVRDRGLWNEPNSTIFLMRKTFFVIPAREHTECSATYW